MSKAYQAQGAAALISKKRGRASNRQTPVSIKAQALAVISERYADFGPTLAAEKLRELHGITIGRETLRIWMLEAGLWTDRQKRRGRVYQPRSKRRWSISRYIGRRSGSARRGAPRPPAVRPLPALHFAWNPHPPDRFCRACRP